MASGNRCGQGVNWLLADRMAIKFEECLLLDGGTGVDVKPYTDSIRRRAEAWAAQCEAARRTARQDAEKLASFLTAKGATKVVLFGSLAREKDFTPDSDIDLATEGISWPAYWRILSTLQHMTSFKVDLVVLEDAGPDLRQRVLREGVELAGDSRRQPAPHAEGRDQK